MNKTIHDILEDFRDDATSNRELGDRFERLMCRYFELDPIYADRFSRVWLWNEWPQKGAVGDVGIDIVAEERATGEFCAVQCKFYQPDHTLAKEDIDSFFTAAGKKLFTSCIIVSTTDKWSKNAEHALENQSKPVTRLRVRDLDASPIDWSKWSPKRPQDLARRKVKTPFPHQHAAIDDVVEGFKTADRGKLIMACGTGKTFTSLRIAEQLAQGSGSSGHVLFLVPSLSLLSQSLREWTAEATRPLHCIAVCSDANVGKHEVKDDDEGADIMVHDLAFPATTSARAIVAQHQLLHGAGGERSAQKRMTVVFSTYQSIEAVSQSQKKGLPDFDLVICDEAHRTTGVTLAGEDESHFVKVHQDKVIRARKRLYMTATPRIFGDETRTRAKEAEAELCSMDDPALFGEELHRLGFGKAVGDGLLSDYKVLVLAVDQAYVAKAFQRQLASADFELKLDDATKIIGCWNGLAKRLVQEPDSAADAQSDPAPMRRAVAFSRSIKDSKAFVDKFRRLVDADRAGHSEGAEAAAEERLLPCELDHVDGTFNALARGALLDWLKADAGEGVCRVLSNARCLAEGVDVPALDAVLFLNPRKSQIDVVQSVGRVMRRAPGKKYGYIILPIGIPAGVEPDEALNHNENYKVVWQVLQALRAHDDRFNATVNQIELNEKRPNNIQVIGVGGREASREGEKLKSRASDLQAAFDFPLEQWRDAIFARIVKKCGDRRHWERWAEDVAKIAEAHATRIRALVDGGPTRHKAAFADFLDGLRENINPSIGEHDAIEMLSQHLITRPVFDALFGSSEFTRHNPVSIAMQKMLDALDDQALGEETKTLGRFYDSVRQRASGIDNPEGRQKIALELYETFFKIAFPKMAERLGIVYTPVEVVDFIIHSVSDVLRHEFDLGLGDKDVHIIDPFTGTGTFIVRLLQSGLIAQKDLLRKYQHELHANEIVLLAYYIAAINIEETFHLLRRRQRDEEGEDYRGKKAAAGGEEYVPFEGIVLTDTFQLAEKKGGLEEKMFPENNRRVRRQKGTQVRVVIGNPPYSSKQESENDGNKNLVYPLYPRLDDRIRATYGERSKATLKNSLYDSYVRALRWASDRIEDKGIVAFVTNSSFIDSNAMDGLRASLVDEFSQIYVFNLRGNQRTSGETSRMEGGKIFGSGSRSGVAISVLVKNPAIRIRSDLLYHDIGDYLGREEKLSTVRRFAGVNGIHRESKWRRILPNSNHDWINQRDPAFEKFTALGDKRSQDDRVLFASYSQGIMTSRDNWCYGFSRTAVETNMRRMIDFYSQELRRFASLARGKGRSEAGALVETMIDTSATSISWSRAVKSDLVKGKERHFKSHALRVSAYRPFCRQILYFDRAFNEMVYKIPQIFPEAGLPNVLVYLSGSGNSGKDFSALMIDCIPDYNMQHSGGQGFPCTFTRRTNPKKANSSPITPKASSSTATAAATRSPTPSSPTSAPPTRRRFPRRTSSTTSTASSTRRSTAPAFRAT